MLLKTTSITFLLSSIILFSACSSDLLNQTPRCSDTDVVGALTKVLNTDSRKVTIDVDIIRQTALDEQNGMRTCQTSVDYIYSVDKKNEFMSSFKKAMTGSSDGLSKNNNVTYTVVLGETGKKYIVNLVDGPH